MVMEKPNIRPITFNVGAIESAVTTKQKCITNSEYLSIIDWIDSQISDKNNFILNKYGELNKKTLSKYSHLQENTVLSIIDNRIQHYVRHHHYKVFNVHSKTNAPVQSSTSATTTPNLGQPQSNKSSTNSTKTMYQRYLELAANDSNTSPLITLANNLFMPATLVAKVVVGDHIQDERLKERLHRLNIDESANSTLNDSGSIVNDSSTVVQDSCVSKSYPTEITSANADAMLSQQLNWLTTRLRTMPKVGPVEPLNHSLNSSTNSNSYCSPLAKNNLYVSMHQLCTNSWLIRTDPKLAYEVYKCTVVDCYYGPTIEFIKSCMGKQYEQILRQSMTCFTSDAKSKIKQQGENSFFKTEKECRLRGLDMTPDMVLNEPIAVLLFDDDSDKDYDCNQKTIATHYVGGSDNAIKVVNWIESKAMFGGPEQLHAVMQRQLFPYWNRYGPGSVIFWFGHIIEDNEEDKSIHIGVSMSKPAPECILISKDLHIHNTPTKVNLTESSTYKFWSKYCLLMDGFPDYSRIVMYNQKNNRQNSTKKKLSPTAETV